MTAGAAERQPPNQSRANAYLGVVAQPQAPAGRPRPATWAVSTGGRGLRAAAPAPVGGPCRTPSARERSFPSVEARTHPSAAVLAAPVTAAELSHAPRQVSPRPHISRAVDSSGRRVDGHPPRVRARAAAPHAHTGACRSRRWRVGARALGPRCRRCFGSGRGDATKARSACIARRRRPLRVDVSSRKPPRASLRARRAGTGEAQGPSCLDLAVPGDEIHERHE